MKRLLRALAASTMVAHLLAAAGPTSSVQASPSVAPSSGALLGAWVGNRGGLPHYKSVLNFEAQIGRQLAINQHYRTWDNKYWGEEAQDVELGRIPLITWGDYGKTSAAEINSGSQDALIREKADAIEALEGPVFLRWGSEMAGGKYGTPQEYIAAWKRIRQLFVEQGATNVMWVWCPTAWGFRTGDAAHYYPGDDHVDWIAADGFNYYPAQKPWKSVTDIFKWFYAWASKRGKPLMIAETGVMEDPERPKRKAQWLGWVVRRLKSWPKIKAFVYFHARSPKGYKFWANTSKPAMEAFKKLANRPYMKHMG
jgi:hypothetical protein